MKALCPHHGSSLVNRSLIRTLYISPSCWTPAKESLIGLCTPVSRHTYISCWLPRSNIGIRYSEITHRAWVKSLPLGFPTGAWTTWGAATADIVSAILKVVLMHDPVCFETFERLSSAEDERLLHADNTATACYCFIGTNGIPVPIRRGSALRSMAKEIPLVSSLQRRALEDYQLL